MKAKLRDVTIEPDEEVEEVERVAADVEDDAPEAGLPEEDVVLAGPGGLPWVLFVLALAAAIVFAVLWWGGKASDRRAEDLQATTRQFLLALTNFKAETIQKDVAEIRRFAIGDFSDQVQQFFGPDTVASIRSAKVQSTGQVESVFVESLESDQATVFGVVNESVTNSASATPRTEVIRIEIHLIDAKGGWKIDRVDILQSPGQNPFGQVP
jgi:hypothetical protein